VDKNNEKYLKGLMQFLINKKEKLLDTFARNKKLANG